MSGRNWLTTLTLTGLILGAIVGEFYYRRAADVDNGPARLAEHDALVARKNADDAAWTPADQARLHALRGEIGPVLSKRAFGRAASYIGSDIFMGLLKMLIMPLIVSSVIVGVTSAGDFSRLGRMAGMTFCYFFSTMLLAVALGLVLVSVIQPGRGFFDGPGGDEARATYLTMGAERRGEMEAMHATEGVDSPKTTMDALMGILIRMVPNNPVDDLARGQTLPVIVFSIFFGIILSMIGPSGRPLIDLMRALMDVMIKMTEYVLCLAPVGVFFLVGRAVAGIGLETFAQKIGVYMFTVIAGLLLHGFVVLPLILWIFGRTNPWRFTIAMREALLLAFSTASSSATLPVTIDCAQTRGGCSRRASGFVLPLGSTVNMDGTALYEAVAVVFLAQAFSGGAIPLSDLIILALTATLAAVGAAGIPEAGLTTMIIVITAVNAGGTVYIPPAAIGLILGVDRILDMTRTMINVWGDAVGARIITRREPDGGAPEAG
ncbi:MAG TPA: dicarboxylate/amino acid:cation symporter [Candidatus Sumerlaeota bacterium]|nr:dicarboxylate/amino acid:cation symporter [Candidatus Sumerlaeota bacterium]